jgi:hypothetical protein
VIQKLPPSFPERSSPVCGAEAAFPHIHLLRQPDGSSFDRRPVE